MDIGKYTSPLKLFEYMSNKRLILASNISVIREVLNEGNSILIPPLDYDAWVSTINNLDITCDRIISLKNQAYKDFVKYFTWDIRAKEMLDYIETQYINRKRI